MKIDFNGIIDMEIPSDDELLKVYESVKAQMDEEASYNLLVEIGENTAAMEKTEGAEGVICKVANDKENGVDQQRGVLHGIYERNPHCL